MFYIISALATALVISLGWNYFLTSEARKKFGLAHRFTKHGKNVLRWPWPGCRADESKPGMHTVVLMSPDPFHVMVGFHLVAAGGFIDGFDVFGAGRSRPSKDGMHEYVMHLYLGNKPLDFHFVVDRDMQDMGVLHLNGIVPEYPASEKALFPPHWFQRLGWHG